MSPKLQITSRRMLQVMEHCIANKLRDADTITAWCALVGISHTNIYNIRSGTQQFTVQHIEGCCSVFGVSADFIFGFTNEMFRSGKTRSPIERIKEAAAELELQQKKGHPVEFLKRKKATLKKKIT